MAGRVPRQHLQRIQRDRGPRSAAARRPRANRPGRACHRRLARLWPGGKAVDHLATHPQPPFWGCRTRPAAEPRRTASHGKTWTMPSWLKRRCGSRIRTRATTASPGASWFGTSSHALPARGLRMWSTRWRNPSTQTCTWAYRPRSCPSAPRSSTGPALRPAQRREATDGGRNQRPLLPKCRVPTQR